jgi:hypothetical protein
MGLPWDSVFDAFASDTWLSDDAFASKAWQRDQQGRWGCHVMSVFAFLPFPFLPLAWSQPELTSQPHRRAVVEGAEELEAHCRTQNSM